MAIVVTEYRAEVNQYTKSLDEISKRLEVVEGQEKDVRKQGDKTFKEGAKAAKSFDTSLKKVQGRLGAQIKAWVSFAAAVGLVKNAVEIISKFEQGMADLQAITGATADELSLYEKKVLKVSKSTGKGATEIAKAFQLVGSAQPELLKNADALAQVTEQAVILSKAGGVDVPTAADALTKAMNQFQAGAEDAAMFTDILATAQQRGTATIDQTALALVNAGSAANAAELSFEETNVGIQALAKGGIVGAEAGTALRQVLVKLANQNDNTINPSIVGLQESVNQLADRNLSLRDATELVGEEAAKSLLTLTAQKDVVNELTGGLNEAGNAAEQAATRFDTLTGKTEEAVSAWERFVISLDSGESAIGETLKNIVDGFTDIVDSLTDTGIASKELEELTGRGYWSNGLLEPNDYEQLGDLTIRLRKLRDEAEQFDVKHIRVNLAGLKLEQRSLNTETELGADQYKIYQKTIDDLTLKYEALITRTDEATEAEDENTESTDTNTESKGKQLTAIEKLIKASKARQQAAIADAKSRKDELDADLEDQEAYLDELTGIWDAQKRGEKDAADQRKAITDDLYNLQNQQADDYLKNLDDNAKKQAEIFQKLIESIDTTAMVFNEMVNISGNIATASNNKAIKEIDERERTATKAAREELKRLNTVGQLTEAQAARKQELEQQLFAQEQSFDQQRREEERQNAAIQKSIALFEIGINTAASIAKTAAELGFPAAIPFVALAAASGAAQAAVVATTPLPGFKDGVVGIDGPGTSTSDSIPAMLSKDESVIHARGTKAYREELESINAGKFPELVMRKYVLPQIMELKKQEAQGQAALIAQNIANSIAGGDLSGKRFSKEMAFSRRHDAELTEKLIGALSKSNNTYRA